MTTEAQADLVITHLEAWARGFQEAAELHKQAIRDGDPGGVGVARLVGKYEAYEDAAKALRDHVERIRYGDSPVRLKVVS